MSRAPVDLDTPPYALTWADVDPDAWPVDGGASGLLAHATDVALDALMATPRALTDAPEPSGDWKVRAENQVAAAFARRFGLWAGGFRWAHDEGSIGGGPVSAWCCALHSVQRGDEADLAPTAARAGAALVEWRTWLARLRETFARHAPPLGAGADPAVRRRALAAALDLALAALVELVVEVTHAGDAWHVHMTQVLGWYLEHNGADVAGAERAAERAVSGRFESWVAPSQEVVARAGADWTELAIRALERGVRGRD